MKPNDANTQGTSRDILNDQQQQASIKFYKEILGYFPTVGIATLGVGTRY